MLNRYNAIYLSPHLDDVVLSCGGQIFQRTQAGESVLIVTLTAGDAPVDNLPPFAQAHHDSWSLSADAVENRRAEDRAACASLGADWLHWTLQDCIYRRDPVSGAALYNNDDQLFGPVPAAEQPLIEQLAQQMRALPSADHIIAPLGLGNHVDHQLMRVAAERAVDAPQLLYYEDYPYIQRHGLDGRVAGWTSEVVSVSAEALNAKLHAIRLYDSQVVHLFDSDAAMEAAVRQHSAETNGERLWRLPT